MRDVLVSISLIAFVHVDLVLDVFGRAERILESLLPSTKILGTLFATECFVLNFSSLTLARFDKRYSQNVRARGTHCSMSVSDRHNSSVGVSMTGPKLCFQ